MSIPSELIRRIERDALRPPSQALQVLIDQLLARHGRAVQGILFYGSCLRSGDDLDGLVDLYLLVDRYRDAYSGRVPALLNALLPPNVFYLEREVEGQVLRAKYAVVSLADFDRGTSPRWFHSYLWGRFAQPAAVLYHRNDEVAGRIVRGLAQAVLTFSGRVLPRIAAEFDARQLWSRGLALCYRSELRSEGPGKGADLFNAAPDYFTAVTRHCLPAVSYPVDAVAGTDPPRYRASIPAAARRASRWTWGLRTVQGKLLSVLRLIKAVTTFEGGVDYILWKIERHSGVSVEVAPGLRRRPLLAMAVLSWRLYRLGGFK